MTDPLERAKALLDEAARERDVLRHGKNIADTEIHQLRRRLARAEDAYKEVDQLNQQLKRELEAAQDRVEQARRATREHAGRVG